MTERDKMGLTEGHLVRQFFKEVLVILSEKLFSASLRVGSKMIHGQQFLVLPNFKWLSWFHISSIAVTT